MMETDVENKKSNIPAFIFAISAASVVFFATTQITLAVVAGAGFYSGYKKYRN
jgi:hypothetical protein